VRYLHYLSHYKTVISITWLSLHYYTKTTYIKRFINRLKMNFSFEVLEAALTTKYLVKSRGTSNASAAVSLHCTQNLSCFQEI